MGPLTPEEVAGLLRSSATAIETELEAMPRELASWRPAEGEWCALEVVGHLIEAERRGWGGWTSPAPASTSKSAGGRLETSSTSGFTTTAATSGSSSPTCRHASGL